MTDPLAPMRVKFLARCEEDLLTLRQSTQASQLTAMAHRLAGAAGIFGYHDLGALALRVDDGIRATGEIDKGELDALEQALQALCSAKT